MNLLLRELVRHHSIIRDRPDILDLIKAAHIVVVQQSIVLESDTATVIHSPSNGTKTIGGMFRAPDIPQAQLPFAPPFPLCWIESVSPTGDMMPIRLIECAGKDAPAGTHQHRVRLSGPVGAVVQETAPGVYDVHAVELQADGEPIETVPKYPTMSTITARSLALTTYRGLTNEDFIATDRPPAVILLSEWLREINEGAMAIEHTDAVLMLPRGDGRKHKRKPHRINRIVRIVPKKLYQSPRVTPLTDGGIIDWSHRWEVRGHWRHVKGLGKDRAGEYIVVGYTWVKDFVKGPQDKPLVVKTRELQYAEVRP